MKSNAEPRDPNYEARCRASFDAQRMMKTLGAEITKIAPGQVEIEMPFQAEFTQQHGYLHAAAVTAVLDNACGYASSSLAPPNASVLTVEYKVNLMAPAVGERCIARATVKRSGRTLTVCAADAFMLKDGAEEQVATMTATMMTIYRKEVQHDP